MLCINLCCFGATISAALTCSWAVLGRYSMFSLRPSEKSWWSCGAPWCSTHISTLFHESLGWLVTPRLVPKTPSCWCLKPTGNGFPVGSSHEDERSWDKYKTGGRPTPDLQEFSSFELLFGKKPRDVPDVIKENWRDGPNTSKNQVQYVSAEMNWGRRCQIPIYLLSSWDSHASKCSKVIAFLQKVFFSCFSYPVLIF